LIKNIEEDLIYVNKSSKGSLIECEKEDGKLVIKEICFSRYNVRLDEKQDSQYLKVDFKLMVQEWLQFLLFLLHCVTLTRLYNVIYITWLRNKLFWTKYSLNKTKKEDTNAFLRNLVLDKSYVIWPVLTLRKKDFEVYYDIIDDEDFDTVPDEPVASKPTTSKKIKEEKKAEEIKIDDLDLLKQAKESDTKIYQMEKKT